MPPLPVGAATRRADTAEPIRILRVIARLNVGGPALHVAYLAAGLEDRGYRTTLAAGALAPGEGSMRFVADELGVPVVSIPHLHRTISPVRDAIAVVQLVRLIRRIRPHVMHTHTAKAGAVGRVAALLAGGSRPIIVHTFHGHVLRGYFGVVQTTAFRFLERWLARYSDALVAVSPQVRDDLVALRIAPAARFAVIRLGIELRKRIDGDARLRDESRTLLGVPRERFLVGWLGRITDVKRPGDILRALKALRERDVDAALCMVGGGPDSDALEEEAYRLGIARHCFYLGYQESVADWYAAVDAVVLPSANEGTPVTVIEALAAGRPVVATRVGGLPDVVREGVDGYLVEPGDVDAIADRLAALARDPDLRASMGAAGRERVLGRYAVDRLVADVDLLYRSLLDVTDGNGGGVSGGAR